MIDPMITRPGDAVNDLPIQSFTFIPKKRLFLTDLGIVDLSPIESIARCSPPE